MTKKTFWIIMVTLMLVLGGCAGGCSGDLDEDGSTLPEEEQPVGTKRDGQATPLVKNEPELRYHGAVDIDDI